MTSSNVSRTHPRGWWWPSHRVGMEWNPRCSCAELACGRPAL